MQRKNDRSNKERYSTIGGFMGFLVSGIICAVCASVNLPGVLLGNTLSLCSLILCGALAVFSFAMAVKNI
jgi:hypothetical protein